MWVVTSLFKHGMMKSKTMTSTTQVTLLQPATLPKLSGKALPNWAVLVLCVIMHGDNTLFVNIPILEAILLVLMLQLEMSTLLRMCYHPFLHKFNNKKKK